MPAIRAPDADMLAVSRSSRNQRKSILNFAPPGLNIVDYGRLDEVDGFYNDCQNLRDYYRDPNNKLPLPVPFKKHYGQCGYQYAKDNNTSLLMLPDRYVRQTQPMVCPINFGRELDLGGGFRLGGCSYPTSDVLFKH